MSTKSLSATMILPALALAATLTPAHADRSGSSQRFFKKPVAIEAAQDGSISREQFLELAGRLWDANVQQARAGADRLNAEQLQQLQRLLARTSNQ
jgi:hypothetical protein